MSSVSTRTPTSIEEHPTKLSDAFTVTREPSWTGSMKLISSIATVTTGPREWRMAASPAALSTSFMMTPPWTKPARLASSMPMFCESTTWDSRTARSSTRLHYPCPNEPRSSTGERNIKKGGAPQESEASRREVCQSEHASTDGSGGSRLGARRSLHRARRPPPRNGHPRGPRRRRSVQGALPRPRRRSRRPGPRGGGCRAGAHPVRVRACRVLRLPLVLDRHRGSRPWGAAAAGGGAVHRAVHRGALLRAGVGGGRRRQGRSPPCRPGDRRPPPLPGLLPPLPALPPLRARGDADGREGDDVVICVEPVGLEEALSKLQQPDREVRRRTAEALTEALQSELRTRAYIFNTLLLDKATEDRRRGYPSWIASRNLSNEASDASVQALVDAVIARYDIPQRYYRLKAKLLGLDRLADYDRMAPILATSTPTSWDEARATVLDAYSSFSPVAGAIVSDFFERRWIDAAVRPNKQSGAFCATTIPGAHPYVLLSFTRERRSVLTLAHELGHGVHGVLAGDQGLFNAQTPLTLAETASVFGEALTFQRLLAAEPDPRRRLELLVGRLEDAIATTFRQVAMNRFEDGIRSEERR